MFRSYTLDTTQQFRNRVMTKGITKYKSFKLLEDAQLFRDGYPSGINRVRNIFYKMN